MNGPDIQALIDKYGEPAWIAAQRQIWVNFWSDIAGVVVLLILAVGLVILAKKADAMRRRDSYSMGDVAEGLCALFAVLATLGAIAFAVTAIQILANPEWAAIQTLISLVPGSGG